MYLLACFDIFQTPSCHDLINVCCQLLFGKRGETLSVQRQREQLSVSVKVSALIQNNVTEVLNINLHVLDQPETNVCFNTSIILIRNFCIL